MDNEQNRRDMEKIGRQLGLFRGASTAEIFRAALNRVRTETGLPPVEKPSSARLFIMTAPKNDN